MLKQVQNYLPYLFGTIQVMFFNLFVGKLEDLEAIRISGLSSLGLTEEVYHLLVVICLLNVSVIKIYNSVSIWEGFTPHFIAEDHFFFAVAENSLDLSVLANNFIFDCHIGSFRIMILIRVLKIVDAPVFSNLI